MFSSHRKILPSGWTTSVVLVSWLFPLSVTPSPAEVHYFPENERFGYVCFGTSSENEPISHYQIVARPDSRSLERPIKFPYLITSDLPPQMCDTNAVSFITSGTERNYLVTITFEDILRIDTVFEFQLPKSRSGRSFRFPDTCIYTPDDYVYVARANVLACLHIGHRPLMEIVRLTNSREYRLIRWSLALGLCQSGDFSRIIWTPGGGPPLIGDTSQYVLAYDIARDTSEVLLNRSGIGPPVKQRNAAGALFCRTGSNLGRVDGDSLVVLTDFQDPVHLTDFTLFADSIVVLYQRYCDAEFGTRRLVIRKHTESDATQ